MALNTVVVTGDKVRRAKSINKIVRIVVLILLILLAFLFLLLKIIYNGGNFVITLDRDLYLDSSIVIYTDSVIRDGKAKLYAEELPYMDNISINWLPDNLDTSADGPHNGENYIAYTFYIENKGSDIINYWYQIAIDDVIKNVDEAVRIMIYHNGESKVYAKINSYTAEPEENTIKFYSDEYAILENVSQFKPNQIDKFTIVVWLEGDDPDCVDNIIGGDLKMHMEIRAENLLK